jgi:hypothetical protein
LNSVYIDYIKNNIKAFDEAQRKVNRWRRFPANISTNYSNVIQFNKDPNNEYEFVFLYKINFRTQHNAWERITEQFVNIFGDVLKINSGVYAIIHKNIVNDFRLKLHDILKLNKMVD